MQRLFIGHPKISFVAPVCPPTVSDKPCPVAFGFINPEFFTGIIIVPACNYDHMIGCRIAGAVISVCFVIMVFAFFMVRN